MTLQVRTDIPHGNAGYIRVSEIGPGTAEVRFMPDPHGAPETLWFCFRVEQAEQLPTGANRARRLRIVCENVDTMLGGARAPEHIHPVVRRAGGDWERLPHTEVVALPDGRREIAWEMDAPDPALDIALCYPYGWPELHTLLRETGDYWKADAIGLSQGGRPLVRLSNDYGTAGNARPGLFVLARQHSGETPGSWALDGFLRRMAEFGPRAPLIWCIPFTNIDGVVQGDYGKDNFPHDLNRAWGYWPLHQPMRHEILVMQSDYRRWMARCAPVAGLDFHAPGASQTEGLYTYLPRPSNNPEAAQIGNVRESAARFAAALGEYAADPFAWEVDYPTRWPFPSALTYGEFTWGLAKIPGVTIEVPYSKIRDMMLTRERYREAGSRIAAALVAYLST